MEKKRTVRLSGRNFKKYDDEIWVLNSGRGKPRFHPVIRGDGWIDFTEEEMESMFMHRTDFSSALFER